MRDGVFVGYQLDRAFAHGWGATLTIHESIGHATEYDRAIGYEAAYAGTSFATPDKRVANDVTDEMVRLNWLTGIYASSDHQAFYPYS